MVNRQIYLRYFSDIKFKLVYELPDQAIVGRVRSSSDGVVVFASSNFVLASTNGIVFRYISLAGGDSGWRDDDDIEDVCVFSGKVVVVKSGYAWHDDGDTLLGSASSVAMRRIAVPDQQPFVEQIPIAVGSIVSCGIFRSDQGEVSKLLLGGVLGFVSISKIPVSFPLNDQDRALESVQYTYTDIPNHVIESVNGKVVTGFLYSVFSTSNNKIISIKNGISL